ncbi:bifunctional ADP-dependent NAD(P)H-hydrate dehydratase/NAD(P)H-hydrate epimerase [Pseudidiomarina aestuarii]|uniref:Bifunctional NAD(P)H-hydrate repair enzyme n=1 Tax=Pseudidiomarina aestuarii TaxID=624146 RepID=A0A6N4DHJ0_9GAMM|nr:bifunctional ADP-dependent NAD(P)H-hydrate dehydratase/NAD(P)H-hydrate epimerase [Pseudidiomarina aestuarii]
MNRDNVYTTATIRSGELAAAEACGLDAKQLMQRAAQACVQKLQQVCPAPARILVLCGPGNNGGDAWFVARYAQQAHYQVTVVAAQPKSELAKQAAAAWREADGRVIDLAETLSVNEVDWVVDGLLGNGVSREVSGHYRRWIETLNQSAVPVLSIDIPSGLDSDSGQPQGLAVRARDTVTMIAWKPGLLTGEAVDYVGHLTLADLDVGRAFEQQQSRLGHILTDAIAERLLQVSGTDSAVHPNKVSQQNVHKGTFGHIVIVGGGPGMAGAAILAGQAALRSGAGKVSVLCHPDSRAIIAQAQPELMVESFAEGRHRLEQANVVAVGPGLGFKPENAWAHDTWREVMSHCVERNVPMVIDADGLNWLAHADQCSQPLPQHTVLTPHPAEAARLLGCSAAVIQNDRVQAIQQLVENFSATVVLKGAGTLVAAPQQSLWFCRRGSSALATAGTGDVLTGVIATLLVGRTPVEAAAAAVWLHARAGEIAALDGERGTLASDLLPIIRQLRNAPNY